MEVGPRVDIQVGRDRDEISGGIESRCQQCRQGCPRRCSRTRSAGRTPSSPGPGGGPRPCSTPRSRSSAPRPDRSGARRTLRQALVARPTQVDARGGIEGHQSKDQEIARCGIPSGTPCLPRRAVAVDVDVQRSQRRAGAAEHDVLKRRTGHHLPAHPDVLSVPRELLRGGTTAEEDEGAARGGQSGEPSAAPRATVVSSPRFPADPEPSLRSSDGGFPCVLIGAIVRRRAKYCCDQDRLYSKFPARAWAGHSKRHRLRRERVDRVPRAKRCGETVGPDAF